MTEPGRYETMLGELGAFLAAQDAHQIEIVDEGTFLALSWQSGGEARQSRCLGDGDMDQLRKSSWVAPQGSSSRAPLLSALGHEIDEARVDLTRIGEDVGGFLVSGTSGGRYLSWCCEFSDLRSRGQSAPTTPLQMTQPTPSGTSGVPVSPVQSPKPVDVGTDAHLSPLRHRLQLTR